MVLHILQIDYILCCCAHYLFRDQYFHILVVLLEVVDWVLLPKLRMGLPNIFCFHTVYFASIETVHVM
jgi:hypothetical protein